MNERGKPPPVERRQVLTWEGARWALHCFAGAPLPDELEALEDEGWRVVSMFPASPPDGAAFEGFDGVCVWVYLRRAGEGR